MLSREAPTALPLSLLQSRPRERATGVRKPQFIANYRETYRPAALSASPNDQTVAPKSTTSLSRNLLLPGLLALNPHPSISTRMSVRAADSAASLGKLRDRPYVRSGGLICADCLSSRLRTVSVCVPLGKI